MKQYHYTYQIINLLNKISYIGLRTSNIEPEKDLGHKYFSSSTDSLFMKEQIEYPLNFKYEILNVFDNRLEAINDEMRLHEMYDVGSNPMFYNKQKQGSHVIDFTGKNHTEDSKIKIGVASKERGISDKARENLQWHGKNRKRTEEEKKKMANAKLGNTNASGKRSEEVKRKISEAKKGKESSFKGKTHSIESKKKMSNAKSGDNNPKYWKGKNRLDETKRKISENRKGKGTGPAIKTKCPHCKKEGGYSAMMRWHFNNCSKKNI
jgi:hypothetical protein